jgi:predicted RNA-binding protein with TRAM domain
MERRFSRPRFGNRGFGDRFEKPVKVGEEYDVEIKEVGSRGDGIARVKNFVIFVANTKKGDKCKIKINHVSRRFAIGEKVGETEKVEETKEVKKESEKTEEKKPEKKEKKPKEEKKEKKTKTETKESKKEEPIEESEGENIEDK